MKPKVLKQSGVFTMRAMKRLLAIGAVWMVHVSGALGPLLAGQGLAGGAVQNAGLVDSLATSPDLEGLERRIQSTIEKASPSIVFMGWDGGTGTGTIISPEGLILTQGHVLGNPMKAGLKFRLSFRDGTAAEAEVVGADALHDLTLLRLVEPGAYPFLPLAERTPEPGTAVLKFGYPVEAQEKLGSLKGRPASVRFGTVLATKPDIFVADCGIDGGDSGGPFVDLDGRVVGIIGSATAIRDEPIQAPFFRNLYNTRGRSWYVSRTSTLVRERLARMAKGEFILPTEAERGAFNFMGSGRDVRNPILYRDLIAERRRTQGEDALGRFRDGVAKARRGVVEVLDGEKPTALGTVVDASGLVVTKASGVSDPVRCRLPGGRVVPAEVVGVDPAYDLALLRVQAEGLVPVAWARAADPPAGTLLAAAGAGELPLAVGIVSVARRDTPGPHPTAPRRYRRPDLLASPPELTGFTARDGGFVVETSEGNAAAAGIRPGDVILTMAGKPVPDNSWLKRSQKRVDGFYIPIKDMHKYDVSYYTFQALLPLATNPSDEKARRAGERVPVRLLRVGEPIELSLELPAPKEKELGFVQVAWNRLTPTLADAPPTVIIADLPSSDSSECGAPVLGIDGAVLGLVIRRFGPTGSLVIPADRIVARLADLKAGKPLSGFSNRAAEAPRQDSLSAPEHADMRSSSRGRRRVHRTRNANSLR